MYGYKLRFVKAEDEGDLINVYHLSRVGLADIGHVPSVYERMVWTANAFQKEHTELSATGIYKDLCGILGR